MGIKYETNRHSQGTIEGFHSILMLIVNDAVEEDYLDKNRLKKVTLEKENNKLKTEKSDRFIIVNEDAASLRGWWGNPVEVQVLLAASIIARFEHLSNLDECFFITHRLIKKSPPSSLLF